jgi:arginine deiminase
MTAPRHLIRTRALWPSALFLLVLLSLAWAAHAQDPAVPVGCRAEWDRPTDVLLHTPGDELFLGVLHPEAALFECPFSIDGAAAEHRRYLDLLRAQGAHVYTVVETLLAGTLDAQGRPLPGPALDQLRNFAKGFVKLDTSKLKPEEQAEQVVYLDKTLAALHPRELVRIILQCPTVRLRYSLVPNMRYTASYELSPVMNLYFCRDQQITTAKGVVMSRMNSEQRAVETEILRFVLGKLGIQPIYAVTGEGRLEGGDFLPAGDIALLGQGLRTNAEGVRQLLEHAVFGTPRVAIVKDPWQKQVQMHLDTYFNILGPRRAVLVEERMDIRGPDGRIIKPAVPEMRCKVDLYELQEGQYVPIRRDIDFQSFLEKEMGFTLTPVPNADQLKYGVNFLCVGPERILAIDGVSPEYKARLKGIEATWMDFRNLTGGYGAAHCTSQVLHRAPVSSDDIRGIVAPATEQRTTRHVN